MLQGMCVSYLSVCSGIEAATVAWEPLGWRPVAFAEVEPFPSAVLAHHYPKVPNLGDMTRFKEWPDAAFDVLVGGTPCQSFSVAGLRKGLDDPRGNLALVYLGLAERFRPDWVVWENVPGVLSSNRGRDFGAFLGALGKLGYGFAYRVLDAQFVRTRRFSGAVPQRRRRVFVVGYLGDWRPATAVLFDRESLQGNPPPRREAGQGFTLGTLRGTDGGSDVEHARAAHLIPAVSNALSARDFKQPRAEDNVGILPVAFDCKGSEAQSDVSGATPTLRAMGHAGSHANAGGQLAVAFDAQAGGNTALGIGENVAGALHGGGKHGGRGAVAFVDRARGDDGRGYARSPAASVEVCGTLETVKPHNVATRWAVRRLTPLECERLQGFPDGYTDVPYGRRNWTPDGPRYKALGNSMAVNVMEWIGRRIEFVRRLV